MQSEHLDIAQLLRRPEMRTRKSIWNAVKMGERCACSSDVDVTLVDDMCFANPFDSKG